MVQDAKLEPITLQAVRGDTKSWTFTVDWDNVIDSGDLTSCRFTVLRAWDDDTIVLQLDTSGGVTVGATTVVVALDTTAAETLATIAQGVWDIEARTASQIRTVALGIISIQTDATTEAPA